MFSRFSLLKQSVRHCQPFLFNRNVKKQIFKQCFAATTRRNTKVGGVIGIIDFLFHFFNIPLMFF